MKFYLQKLEYAITISVQKITKYTIKSNKHYITYHNFTYIVNVNHYKITRYYNILKIQHKDDKKTKVFTSDTGITDNQQTLILLL